MTTSEDRMLAAAIKVAERNTARRALEKALRDVADWQNKLAEDGPDLRINAHKKTAHEAAELAAEPSLEEFADVVICLVATANHHGWTVEEIAETIAAKTAVNRQRTWGQKPDGTWQHISGPDTISSAAKILS